MTLSELLRSLADKIDKIENSNQQSDNDKMSDTDSKTMINPQQQKLELLKKSVGVSSVFDEEDEVEIIKQNAGLGRNPTAIQIASDDDPLE